MTLRIGAFAAACAVLAPATAFPQAAPDARDARDPRESVGLPPMMREHMLSNMRDHLAAVGEILAALGAERYGDAGRVAAERLGLDSLKAHDAAHMAPHMPKGMQEAGIAMHRAASRFAIAAADADVDRSYAALVRLNAALGEVTGACVACHAQYRLAPVAP